MVRQADQGDSSHPATNIEAQRWIVRVGAGMALAGRARPRSGHSTYGRSTWPMRGVYGCPVSDADLLRPHRGIIEENKSSPNRRQSQAPYLKSLAVVARDDQVLRVAHPASRTTWRGSPGHTGSPGHCPVSYPTRTLAHQLSTAGKTFAPTPRVFHRPATPAAKRHYSRKIEPWTGLQQRPGPR